jgi:acyl-CoA thioesterase I
MRADFLVKVFLWLALVAIVAPAPLRAAEPPAAPTLLVLGDSLSAAYGIRVDEGWVALLAARLAEKGYGYRVVNASISGETSSGALARLPHLLASQQPGFLIVEIGANDGLRGLPLADIRSHLKQIIAAARTHHIPVLLLGIRLPANYGPAYGDDFARLYRDIAREEHAPLVPFLLAPVAEDARYFQADGLHPTAAAEPLVMQHVWRSLAPLLDARAMRPAS